MKATRKSVVREGLPHPCGATWDGEVQNSHFFQPTPRKSSFACLTSAANGNSSALRFRNIPIRSGTVICLESDRPRFTDTGFIDLMIPRSVTDLMQQAIVGSLRLWAHGN